MKAAPKAREREMEVAVSRHEAQRARERTMEAEEAIQRMTDYAVFSVLCVRQENMHGLVEATGRTRGVLSPSIRRLKSNGALTEREVVTGQRKEHFWCVTTPMRAHAARYGVVNAVHSSVLDNDDMTLIEGAS